MEKNKQLQTNHVRTVDPKNVNCYIAEKDITPWIAAALARRKEMKLERKQMDR